MAIAYHIRGSTAARPAGEPLLSPECNDLASIIEGAGIAADLSPLLDLEPSVGSLEKLPEAIAPSVRLAKDVLRGRSCSLFLVAHTGKRDLIEFSSLDGTGMRQHRSDGRLPSAPHWVVETGQPLLVNKPEDLPWPLAALTGPRSPYERFVCVPLATREQTLGAMLLTRSPDSEAFQAADMATFESVGSMTAIAIDNLKLRHSITEGYRGTIKALAGAIDAKDPYTCGHSQRVADYALMAGETLSLSTESTETLEYAAVLHDIGKIGIDDAILRKPSRLNPRERSAIESHPVIGAAIVRSIPFLKATESLVLYHHERYDGAGYPHKLREVEIPLGARIICVADSFDTMTTDRPYRQALTINEAMTELKDCTGTQFCPTAVNAFATGFARSYQHYSP